MRPVAKWPHFAVHSRTAPPETARMLSMKCFLYISGVAQKDNSDKSKMMRK